MSYQRNKDDILTFLAIKECGKSTPMPYIKSNEDDFFKSMHLMMTKINTNVSNKRAKG